MAANTRSCGPPESEQQVQLEAIRRYYRLNARIYDSTRWTFLFGRSALVSMCSRYPVRRVLEVGCGTGSNLIRLASTFPDAEVIGIDISQDMLEIARRRTAGLGNVALAAGRYDGEVLATHRGDPFDLIVFSYVLTMVNPGWDELLKGCRRDLSRHGRVAVVDFHDSRFSAFHRWMKLNHVRMNGRILAAADELFSAQYRSIRQAYGGIWSYFLFVGSPADRAPA